MTESISDDNIVKKFQDYLKSERVCRRNYKNQVFYCQDDIKTWFLECTNGVTNEIKLLKAVFDYHPDTFAPCEARDIVGVRLLFALLVDMGCGHMINNFRKHISSDSDLRQPTLNQSLRLIADALEHDGVEVPAAYSDQGYKSIISTFDTRRWAFVPAFIRLRMDTALSHERNVLPFCHMKEINTGGTATVYHYKIQTEMVCPELKEILGPTKKYDPKFGEHYELAVKTYSSGFEDVYRKETIAFKGMQRQQGLGVVKHLGEYRTHTSNGEYTDNILLELGEQDLDEYLEDAGPPILNQEIIQFWESLFEVARTLKRIHQLDYQSEDGTTRQFNGWHGDIKPANILRIRGKLKLADFGFAKFEKHDTCKTKLMGGTRSYGAPERDSKGCRDGNATQSQTVDTWSFGCVLSAVATWVTLGPMFYHGYGGIRQGAIQELRQGHKSSPSVCIPDLDDAFHDGNEVLPVVLNWHKHLRNSAKRADTISHRVLDLVDQHMLVSNPEARFTSAQVCDRLDEILKEAREEYQSKVDNGELTLESRDTLKALLKLDQRSPSTLTTVSQTCTGANPFSNASASSNRTVGPGQEWMPVPHSPRRVRKSECYSKMRIGKTATREDVIGSGSTLCNGIDGSDECKIGSPLLHNSNPFQIPIHGRRIDSQLSSSELERHLSHSPPRISMNTSPIMSAQNSHLRSPTSSQNWHPVNTPNYNHQNNNRVSSYTLPGNSQSSASRRSFNPTGNNAVLKEYDDLIIKQESSRSKLSSFLGRTQKDSFLRKWIYERDIKFVIDNAESMKSHWDNVKKTLLVLAMKLGPLDEDGLDLIYASGPQDSLERVAGRKIWPKFEQSMKKAYEGLDGVQTDMRETLSRIFDQYNNSSGKKQTLIVLTDGLWLGSGQNDGVESVIREFVNKLHESKAHYERRRFSIQFIYFGDDPDAIKRLQAIDDDLRAAQDVVDTKPWYYSNINSLILGSMKDAEDEEVEQSFAPTF